MTSAAKERLEQDNLTPMMRQYHAIKQEYPEALLLFRLGDFYELFFDDAVTASRELEITLTARNKERDNPVPMCGVPYHAADNYIARLLRKGFKVAICDQTEVPKKGVKLVRREITRVITPGTVTDSNVLSPGQNNFLLAVNGYANRDIPPDLPPDVDFNPRKNMVIMFANICACTIHAYDDPKCWQMQRQGQMIRMPVKGIGVMGRNTQGVTLVKLDAQDGELLPDKVASVTRVVSEDGEAGEPGEAGETDGGDLLSGSEES